MDNFNEYMEEFKQNSLEEKRKIALEQLKILTSLTTTMCDEVNVKSEPIITKDIVEAQNGNSSEEDFVEAVVVYASSIQKSLCDFVENMTKVMEKATRE